MPRLHGRAKPGAAENPICSREEAWEAVALGRRARSSPDPRTKLLIPRLGCLFMVVPLVELALLVQVGRWVGVLPTVGIVAATALLGAALIRREGMLALARLQGELARGRMPGRALLDGAFLLVAGAFLLTPGVLTDLVALALLFPPTRRVARGWLLARLGRAISRGTVRVQWGGFGGFPGGGPEGDRAGEPSAEGEDRDEGGEDDGDGPPRGPRRGEIIQE